MSNPGGKVSEGKVDVWNGLFVSFPYALQAIAAKTMQGAAEPGHYLHGWMEVPEGYREYSAALGRHLLVEAKAGEYRERVEEAVAVAWNAVARLEHLIKNGEGRRGGIDEADRA